MNQNELKTSWGQRIMIAVIAAILLGSTLAVYVSIVLSDSNSSSTSGLDEEKIAALEEKYDEKYTEYQATASSLGETYFETLSSYRSEVSSYNAEAANSVGVSIKDLKVGDGEEITSESEGYGAYYIGWCPDEEVFDSSFNDFSNPTTLNAPLIVEKNALIAGWYKGVDGMRVGGVREVSISSDYAYASSDQEESTIPCGSKTSPIKFIILTVPISDEFKTLASELSEIYTKLMYSYYGN